MELGKEERLDEIGFKGLKLIQTQSHFCYGTDAVLLSHFVKSTTSHEGKFLVELGSGNGAVLLLLWKMTGAKEIFGVEVQRELWEVATRNIVLNGAEKQIRIDEGDVSSYFTDNPKAWSGKADIVVLNPPYVARGGGIPIKNSNRHIARQETTATLKDFIEAASFILKDKGELVMVHRPKRLVEIITAMTGKGIEPRTIRFVHPKENEEPNIILVHGIKGAGRELKVLKPLYVYDNEGLSQEVLRIYGKDKA